MLVRVQEPCRHLLDVALEVARAQHRNRVAVGALGRAAGREGSGKGKGKGARSGIGIEGREFSARLSVWQVREKPTTTAATWQRGRGG